MARRLVEAGAKFINVYFSNSIGGDAGGWDTHGFNNKPMYPILKRHLLPVTDQTVPTLLDDLDQRGLLETTLVVWVGEFGRTPRINNNAGRDHWPKVSCALLAGGGMKVGQVIGATNRLGEEATERPVHFQEIFATLYKNLGIDVSKARLTDPAGRPQYLVEMQPIAELA